MTWSSCCDKVIIFVDHFVSQIENSDEDMVNTKFGGTIQRWFCITNQIHKLFRIHIMSDIG